MTRVPCTHPAQSSASQVVMRTHQQQTAMLAEYRRQQYLAAIGVQSWFARIPLTHAKPSHTCEWPPELRPLAQQERAPVAAPQTQAAHATDRKASLADRPPAAPSAGLSELACMLDTETVSAPSDQSRNSGNQEQTACLAVPGTSPDPHQKAPPAPPFRVVAIHLNETTLALTDMPHSGLNRFTPVHERLLLNIARAARLDIKGPLHHTMFVWPMAPSMMQVEQKYATAALCSFLDTQFGLSRRQTVLLFGPVSTTAARAPFSGDGGEYGYHRHHTVDYVVTHSLDQLLHQPALKASTWQHIQALTERGPSA